MTIKARELEMLCKVMKKHKVESVTHGDLIIKLSPLAHVEKEVMKNIVSSDKVTEDDLYFSATNFKKKVS
jgi:hypothetical protein